MYHFLRYLSSLTLESVLSPWGFSVYSFHCLKCSSHVYLAHCCLLGPAQALFITSSPLVAFTPTPSLDTLVTSPHFISFLPHITKYSYFILAICIVLSSFTQRQVVSFRIFFSLPVDFKKIPPFLSLKLSLSWFLLLRDKKADYTETSTGSTHQVTGRLTATTRSHRRQHSGRWQKFGIGFLA